MACKKEEEPIIPVPEPEPNTYIHISHTRTKENPDIEAFTATLDFSKYDMRWLGGDLADQTSNDEATMINVDTIFNLGSPNTLWSLGNHDYANLERVEKYTGRPPIYSTTKDGLCFIILDTHGGNSSFKDEQYELIKSVTDTISECSHLILLHHHLVWLSGNAELEPDAASISNAPIGNCEYCIRANNFYDEVYPLLLDVEDNGIEVICLAGDIGRKSKYFEYETPENITFLASGIENEDEGNQALLFTHDLKEKKLTWEFKLLTEL